MDLNSDMNARLKLKGLAEQVIVITGASSGIGLATAMMAAERGAKLVLASRNRTDLEKICSEINAKSQAAIRAKSQGVNQSRGVRAIAVVADVADVEAVQRIADRAIQEFGGFDTWVNNAGIAIYGKLTEVPMAEKKRLMDVNFWGVVNGCRAAIPVLRQRGGVIINIGSILSERAFPIQGIYAASKHAVKAYTEALRMELEAEGAPISVSLIKPAAIDTPYTEHAANHMAEAPVHTPPVYAPEVVARAILECAERPRRDVFIGGSAKLFSLMETFLPRLADLFMEKSMMEPQQSNDRAGREYRDDALFNPPRKGEGRTRGHYPGRVMESSAYTEATLHPGAATLVAAGIGIATAAGIAYLQNRQQSPSTPLTQ